MRPLITKEDLETKGFPFYRQATTRLDDWTTVTVYEQVEEDEVLSVEISKFSIAHKGDDHCTIGKFTSTFRQGQDGTREFLLGEDRHALSQEEFDKAYLEALASLTKAFSRTRKE
jgi:hypothetical protein